MADPVIEPHLHRREREKRIRVGKMVAELERLGYSVVPSKTGEPTPKAKRGKK